MPDASPRQLGSSILQIKVRLLAVSPMVLRRLLVPSSYTVRELHGVIQVAMGWEATHLYRFFIRAVHYGSIELGIEIPDVTLESFQFRKNAKFTYDHDMGDLWRHEIRVEDEGETEAGKRYPLCIGGKRALSPGRLWRAGQLRRASTGCPFERLRRSGTNGGGRPAHRA